MELQAQKQVDNTMISKNTIDVKDTSKIIHALDRSLMHLPNLGKLGLLNYFFSKPFKKSRALAVIVKIRKTLQIKFKMIGDHF